MEISHITRFPGLQEGNYLNDGRDEKEILLYIYCHVNILPIQKVNKISIQN